MERVSAEPETSPARPARSQSYLHSDCVHALRLYLIMAMWWQACRIVKKCRKRKMCEHPREEMKLFSGGTAHFMSGRQLSVVPHIKQMQEQIPAQLHPHGTKMLLIPSFAVSACLLSFSGGCLDHVMCQIYGGSQSSTELMRAGGGSLCYRHDGEIKTRTRQVYQRRCR